MQELKVLIVDDSRTARMMLAEMLREMQVNQVVKAEDGADAIEQLTEFPAHTAICDLHMAPLDGIEFTKLLRCASDSPNPYLPVLMVTGDATQTQLVNALNAGVNGFMSKPIQLDALRRQINMLLCRPLVFVRDGRNLKPAPRAGLAAQASQLLSQAPTQTQPSEIEQTAVQFAGTA